MAPRVSSRALSEPPGPQLPSLPHLLRNSAPNWRGSQLPGRARVFSPRPPTGPVGVRPGLVGPPSWRREPLQARQPFVPSPCGTPGEGAELPELRAPRPCPQTRRELPRGSGRGLWLRLHPRLLHVPSSLHQMPTAPARHGSASRRHRHRLVVPKAGGAEGPGPAQKAARLFRGTSLSAPPGLSPEAQARALLGQGDHEGRGAAGCGAPGHPLRSGPGLWGRSQVLALRSWTHKETQDGEKSAGSPSHWEQAAGLQERTGVGGAWRPGRGAEAAGGFCLETATGGGRKRGFRVFLN